jgi:SAM-dependent methyltransferase
MNTPAAISEVHTPPLTSAPRRSLLKSALKLFTKANRFLSVNFDRLLPGKFKTDGYTHFVNTIAPDFVRPDICLYDIGGGSLPQVLKEEKERLNIRNIGFDIAEEELLAAPPGSYDELVIADLTQYSGRGDADLVICRSVLEHVPDNSLAFRSLASIMKPGGKLILFLPSREAWFARLNLVLPEKIKLAFLNFINPHNEEHHGFPAHYDRATLREFEALGRANGLRLTGKRAYYISSYFSYCFPVFLIWRLCQLVKYLFTPDGAAETFHMSFEKETA